METQVSERLASPAEATASRKSIKIKTVIHPPQEIEREIQLPFYSRSKTGGMHYKITGEKEVFEIWQHTNHAMLSFWKSGGGTFSHALEAEPCSEEEFTSAYHRAKEFIESQIKII